MTQVYRNSTNNILRKELDERDKIIKVLTDALKTEVYHSAVYTGANFESAKRFAEKRIEDLLL